ncbi:MAG: putative colanic acid biosynthesis acetyltransferase [Bacteroidota bacterium]
MKSYQKLSTFQLPPNFRGRPGWYVQLWWLVQSLLFKPSPQFMFGWRRWLLKAFGAKIAKGVRLRPSMHTQFPWKVSIGENSWIGDEVVLYSLGEIEIGKDVVISQRSYICTGSHDYNKEGFDIYAQKITIEDECWLATDVYVAPNITIGRGTVVGARSSVFNDLPAGIIAIGSPAKKIKDR